MFNSVKNIFISGILNNSILYPVFFHAKQNIDPIRKAMVYCSTAEKTFKDAFLIVGKMWWGNFWEMTSLQRPLLFYLVGVGAAGHINIAVGHTSCRPSSWNIPSSLHGAVALLSSDELIYYLNYVNNKCWLIFSVLIFN